MNRLSPLLATAALAIALPAFAQTEPISIPPEFTQCLDGLRDAARREGVSETTFRFLTRDLAPDMSVIDKLNYQPEFSMPIWDYLSGLVDDERVQQGQTMLQQHAAVLERVQQRFGVDPATVPTNIVVVDVPSAPDVVAAAAGQGVRIGAVGPQRVRLLTHLDVSRSDAEQAAKVLAGILG